ncbi:MAG: hypothetical protein JWN10_63 [Solirubrobacterales bacterium]|nr:hypothetical protein [Solirubrobacterales bacterium]
MSNDEWQVIEREVPVTGQIDERGARAALRAQIARLERELSATVAERFPYVAAPEAATGSAASAPRLLDLGALEQVRDELVARTQELRARVQERDERERRAREQLERMRLEPGRYKFARLPVRELGQGVCGVWEVRPRLGLIGMLAGWWQLKLSSGCPLAMGSRSTRDPDSPRSAAPRACDAVARSSTRSSSSQTSGPG